MTNNQIFNMYFGVIDDARCQADVTHPLKSILKLVMLAVLSGIDELDKIVDYGKNKRDFLMREFDIKEIPSKSTLTRVFAMISPYWLGLSMVGILKSIIKGESEQIMISC